MIVEIKARDLDKFRAACKKVDKELGKDLRQVWLKASKVVEARAVGAAPSRAKKAIKGRATQRAAFIRVTPKRGDELAVVLGQTRRSGWYRRGRYYGSKGKQFRPWVGNQWDPGENEGKPYFIGDAINDSVDEVVEILGDGVEQVARKAGFLQ